MYQELYFLSYIVELYFLTFEDKKAYQVIIQIDR